MIYLNNKIDLVKKIDLWILNTAIFSLLLRACIPANINVVSPDDDFLGVRLAHNLLHGDWLGAWTNTTLLKPPAYSFFLCISHFISLSPIVLTHLLLLGAFIWFTKICSNIKNFDPIIRKIVSRAIFTILAFNPLLFSAAFSRIYRNEIYTVLLTYLFITTLYLVSNISQLKESSVDQEVSKSYKKKIYASSLLLGLLSSFLIMTRTESTWLIYPCLTLVGGLILTSLAKHLRSRKKLKNWNFKIYLLVISLLFFGLGAPLFALQQINLHVYGSSLISDFSSGQFVRAMNLWESVKSGKSSNLAVPVTKEQRMVVYSISPTAKTLQPFLDANPAAASPVNFWISFNCAATGVCDNAGGAWFPFELRDAAVIAGDIDSESKFQNFFKRISDDISHACKARIITCTRMGFAPGVRSLLEMPKKQIASNSVNVVRTWFTLSPMQDAYINNGNDPDILKIWHSVIKFAKVYLPNSSNSWNYLSPILSLLIAIYIPLTVFLFLCCLLFFAVPRSSQKPTVLKSPLIMGIFSLIFFSLGIGVLSIAWGFEALGVYTIPAQPIFLMICVMGATGIVASKKVNVGA